MALKLTQPQTPEMLGINAAQLQAIEDAGGLIELPPASKYIRFGGVSFPRARHILLTWEVWPDKKTAQARTGNFMRLDWLIGPEPNVLEREIQGENGEILEPARVLPTFDQFVGSLSSYEPEDVPDKGVKAMTLADNLDQVRKAAYALAKQWPDFKGATDE